MIMNFVSYWKVVFVSGINIHIFISCFLFLILVVLKTIPKLEPGDGVSSSGVVLPIGQPAVSPLRDERDDESAPKKKARITKKKAKVEKGNLFLFLLYDT